MLVVLRRDVSFTQGDQSWQVMLQRPLAIARTLSTADRILIAGVGQSDQLSLDETLGQLVQKILWHCDGTHTWLEIASITRTPQQDAILVASLLEQHEYVIESAMAADSVIRLAGNPQLFPPLDYVRPSAEHLQIVGEAAAGPAARPAASRQSTRRFDLAGLSVDELIDILAVSYSFGDSRPTPSAGGIYPIDVLVVATRVRHLSPGVYTWDPRARVLLGPGPHYGPSFDPRGLMYSFNYPHAEEPAIWLALVRAVSDQSQKYGNRGLAYTLLEAGMITQSIVESASSRGLSTLVYGGFEEFALTTLLNAAPKRSSDHGREVLITVGLGKGESSRATEVEELGTALGALRHFARNSGWSSSPTGTLTEKLANYSLRLRSVSYTTSQGAEKRSFGVGETSDRADVAALGEAFERYSCTRPAPRQTLPASRRPATEVLDVRAFQPLDANQRMAARLSASESPKRIATLRGEYIWSQDAVEIPHDLLYYWSGENAGRVAIANSSGVAAHGSLDRATWLAFSELVERHWFMWHWLRREPGRTISTRHHLPAATIAALETDGRTVHLAGLGDGVMPTVLSSVCMARAPHVAIGLSCADTLQAAATKAFSEALLASLSWSENWEDLDETTTARLGDATWPEWGMDHAWWYARSGSMAAKLQFLWSGHDAYAPKKPVPSVEYRRWNAVRYVYDTPLDEVRVVRALSARAIPLLFGVRGECYRHPQAATAPAPDPHPLS